jgi:hypothetical protein
MTDEANIAAFPAVARVVRAKGEFSGRLSSGISNQSAILKT